MTEQTDLRLRQRMLLGQRVEGDRLMLADEVLRAALDGTRHLTAAERGVLQASPLTLRRLRVLSRQRASAWRGSRGMLRAAASAALDAIETDDGCWRLHFVPDGAEWRVIVALDAGAPFAPELLRSRAEVKVLDGAGNVILDGHLDADGECEAGWPFDTPPAAHIYQNGAGFSVEPVR